MIVYTYLKCNYIDCNHTKYSVVLQWRTVEKSEITRLYFSVNFTQLAYCKAEFTQGELANNTARKHTH